MIVMIFIFILIMIYIFLRGFLQYWNLLIIFLLSFKEKKNSKKYNIKLKYYFMINIIKI